MRKVIIIILLLTQTFWSYTQTNYGNSIDTIENKLYYNDGKLRSVETYIRTKNGEYLPHGNWVIYYSNGNLFDSITYKFGIPINIHYCYYKNGVLKSLEICSSDSLNYISTIKGFDKEGRIKYQYSQKNGKTFGDCIDYNKNGEIKSYIIKYNNRPLFIPSSYRGLKQYSKSFSKTIDKRFLIKNESEKIVVKNGQIAIVYLSNDSILKYLKIDGLRNDTLYASKFRFYVEHKRKPLKFEKFESLSMKEIDSMIVFPKNLRFKNNSAEMYMITGYAFVADPIAIIPLIGKASELFTAPPLILIGSGLVIGYIGWLKMSRLKPKYIKFSKNIIIK